MSAATAHARRVDARQLGSVDVRPDTRDPSGHLKHALDIPSRIKSLECRDEIYRVTLADGCSTGPDIDTAELARIRDTAANGDQDVEPLAVERAARLRSARSRAKGGGV